MPQHCSQPYQAINQTHMGHLHSRRPVHTHAWPHTHMPHRIGATTADPSQQLTSGPHSSVDGRTPMPWTHCSMRESGGGPCVLADPTCRTGLVTAHQLSRPSELQIRAKPTYWAGPNRQLPFSPIINHPFSCSFVLLFDLTCGPHVSASTCG